MKHIAIFCLLLVLASCEYRSPSAMLQEKWDVTKKSDGYKQTCEYLVDVWMITHPQGILGAAQAISQALDK